MKKSNLLISEKMRITALSKIDGFTRIHRDTGEILYSPRSIISILEEGCLYSGSTLQGRIDASKLILGVQQKPPFIVSPDLMLMPTASLESKNCACINPFRIEKIITKDKNCIIRLDGGFEIEVQASRRTVNNQLELCKQLYTDVTRELFDIDVKAE